MTKPDDIEFRLLLEAIFQRYHYDFRGYSVASLRRRLTQARNRYHLKTFSEVQDRVLNDPDFFPQLLSYLTVQVSELFRDPALFRAVREGVVPYLRTYPTLKVWIAGCAAGEELYSMAILFREEEIASRTIFYCTDINPEALRRAEAGVYEISRIAQFTENHQKAGGKSSLSNYYSAAYGGAVFDKTLRNNVVFSDHSLVTDSVFAEVHLITCRNVLIYFDRALQDRAMGLFKDSLTRRGFLGLGSKESLRFSRYTDSFVDFDKENRIYRKREPV